jgi:nucleoside-diphosphate-sugar epimerase
MGWLWVLQSWKSAAAALMTSSSSGIGRAPYEETRPTSRTSRGRAPDISKSQQSIGYQPVLDVAELLERVIAYEREGGIGPDGRVAG